MARNSRKMPKPAYALFIFEIEGWETNYSLSINRTPQHTGAFNEVSALHIDTTCRHPTTLAGRVVRFSLYGERNLLEPWEWKLDSAWRPSSVAILDMRRSGGNCYGGVPQDSFWGLISALGHSRVRYVSLHGSPLVRGKSVCWSIDFSWDEGLDDGS